MKGLVFALLLTFVFVPQGFPQRNMPSRIEVFVYPIWELGGDQLAEVKAELIDSAGQVIASNVSSAEKPVLTLSTLRPGKYSLRLTHPRMNSVTKPVQLFRSEHWFTESLSNDPPETLGMPPAEAAVGLTNLGTFEGKVDPMPRGTQPVWARMMGIFSSVIVDSRVKADGAFDFRIQPGWYVLIVGRGTEVCAMQRVHSFQKIEEIPFKVSLAAACRR